MRQQIQESNLPLPLPMDSEQIAMLERIKRDGCMIASPGTDRHEALSHLADRGYLMVWSCPKAMGVDQFDMAAKGREAIE